MTDPKIVKSQLLKRITEHKFTNKIYCLNCYCLELVFCNERKMQIFEIHTWF